MFACLKESILPAWFRGAPAPDGTLSEDDKDAGITAQTGSEAVSHGHKAWVAAYEKRNFAGLASLYTRDCKVCPPGTRSAYGREECAQGWESLLRGGIEKVAFTDTQVEEAGGDNVVENSSYTMYGKDWAQKGQGKHMMIWKKLDGKWFIHIHIFNSDKKREKTARDYVVEATFRWELHYYTRDFDALGRLYTDNCTLNPPAWPKIENQMPVQRFWARFPVMGIDHFERVPVDATWMGDDLIVADGSYTMFDYKGGVIDIGKMILIYKAQKDGRWCIHTEIFNSDAVMASVSTEQETPN